MSNEGETSKDANTASKPSVSKEGNPELSVTEFVFPDAAAIFTSKAIPLSEIKDTAQIVLDTNALLVPYGIGAQTLAQIEATYRRLLQEERLVVPAQVAREFARNRVTKLSELFQKLSRKRDQLSNFNQGTYPMLEAFGEYQKLQELERNMDQLLADYRSRLGQVLDHIRSWEWNDPVSVIYGRLFSASIVVETSKAANEVKAEHMHRFAHKIPPGYKDQSKSDDGIGDFMVWLSILEVGARRKKSVIFVTGEEKADWWHRVERQLLYPRFELVDEFRRHSDGQSFHIIKFSQLLELFGASNKVVAEVQKEERIYASAVPSSLREYSFAEAAVVGWLMSQGYAIGRPRRDVDFVIHNGDARYAIEIMYVPSGRSSRIERGLEDRARRFRNIALGCPVVVVVVSRDMKTLDASVHFWEKLDPPFRLSTGLLGPDGSFSPVRGL